MQSSTLGGQSSFSYSTRARERLMLEAELFHEMTVEIREPNESRIASSE